MKNLNFTDIASHNTKKHKKNLRNILILLGLCLIGILISSLFYNEYTREVTAVSLKRGVYKTTIGWPVNVLTISFWGAVAFLLFYLLLKFSHDSSKPAFALTEDGVFINQQMIRNAFSPWANIKSVELAGSETEPILRLKFNDLKSLLKGQFFLYKSIMKPSLNSSYGLAISKNNCNGDLKKMYAIIQEKILK